MPLGLGRLSLVDEKPVGSGEGTYDTEQVGKKHTPHGVSSG
jgi:hypothetical protein